MKIHKGDTIQIRAGKDGGKTGKVLKVNLDAGTVVVEGVNVFKKHTRPKKQGEKGQVISLPAPLNVSKVMLYCSSCKTGRRAGYRIEGERKVRYCKHCQGSI